MARRRRQPLWPKVFLALAGVTAVFLIIGQIIADTAPAPVPGWDGLYLCNDVTSLDGTKNLMLDDVHHVIFKDNKNSKDSNERDQNKTIDGEWSFDEGSKRYAITLNGATTVYSVVLWENSNTCLLIKGDLNSANLHESWFSQNEDDQRDTGDRD